MAAKMDEMKNCPVESWLDLEATLMTGDTKRAASAPTLERAKKERITGETLTSISQKRLLLQRWLREKTNEEKELLPELNARTTKACKRERERDSTGAPWRRFRT